MMSVEVQRSKDGAGTDPTTPHARSAPPQMQRSGTVFWVDPRERLIAICMMQSLAGQICDRGLYGNMLYGAIE